MMMAFLIVVGLAADASLVELRVFPKVVPLEFCSRFNRNRREMAAIEAELKAEFPQIDRISIRCQPLTPEEVGKLSSSLPISKP